MGNDNNRMCLLKFETHHMCMSSTDNSQSIRSQSVRSADNGRRVQFGKRLRRTRIEHARAHSAHHLPSGFFNNDFVAGQRSFSGPPWRVAKLTNQTQMVHPTWSKVGSLRKLPTVLLEKVLERSTSRGATASVGVPQVSLPDIRTRSVTRGRSTDRPLSLCEKELLGSVLRQSAVCSEFADKEICQVVSMCTARKYNAEEDVVKYGQQWPFMCCILEGSCQVTKGSGKKLGTISTRCWFGDLAHVNALATVSCMSDVTLVLITQQMLQLVSPTKSHSDIEHLKKIEFWEHLLGEGASGKVLPCVLPNERDKLHAVKCIQKHRVNTRKAKEQVLNEVKLLTQARHPFIVEFTASLQDSQCIYLVMEHLPGGDLFNYMVHSKSLPESAAQFYVANVLCALEHLHDHQIIYRDLKPENLVFDRAGYLKLVDFRFAKKLVDDARTYSLCGTAAYMAPEVLGREGHDKAADMWSVGVLLYEMLVGSLPYNSTYDHPTLCNEITASQFKLSLGFTSSPEAHDFLNCLLCLEPTERLECNKQSYRYARAHKWFQRTALQRTERREISVVGSESAFNWEQLEQSKLVPPYVPVCTRVPCNEKVSYDTLCDRMIKREFLEWTPEFDQCVAAVPCNEKLCCGALSERMIQRDSEYLELTPKLCRCAAAGA